MNYANLSTNCTKITVFVANFNACMNLIHISLLESDAPLLLISGWMRQLKTSSFCLGKSDWKLRHACCYSEAGVWFFFSHCSFAIKFWTIFNICFNDLGESPQPDLFDWPCPHFQMCSCVFHCFKKHVCVSLFPLVYFKIFFLLWKIFKSLVVFPNGLLCCFFFVFAFN